MQRTTKAEIKRSDNIVRRFDDDELRGIGRDLGDARKGDEIGTAQTAGIDSRAADVGICTGESLSAGAGLDDGEGVGGKAAVLDRTVICGRGIAGPEGKSGGSSSSICNLAVTGIGVSGDQAVYSFISPV